MELTILNKKLEINKKTFLQVKKFVVSLITIYFFAMMILLLIDGQNEIYQTLKNIQYAKAIFAFAAFMFVVQKVRLFNWQSLVVSLLYSPLGYIWRQSRAFAPDMFNYDRVLVWIVWLLLMIAVDMAVYKKHTPLERFNKGSLAFFALMTTFLLFFRNGRNYPIVLVLAFMFYLIPMTEGRWKYVVNRMCYGYMAALTVVLYQSVTEHLEVNSFNGRWYGSFVNIGDFGLFLGGAVAVIFYQLYRIKNTKGRLSFAYVLWMLALIVTGWAVLRVSTVTCFIGIIFTLIMGVVVIRKKATLKNTTFRFVAMLIFIMIAAVVGFMVLKALTNTDEQYWKTMLREGNTFLKPLANIICRAHYMFNSTETLYGMGIFEPGSIINCVDLFTSGRLSIIKAFSEYFNIVGNAPMGMQVGTYFAYTTHNTYSQVIFDYGYVAGGLYLAFLVYATIYSAVKFIKEKKPVQAFPCIWMAMLLGVLSGESAHFYFPVVTITFLVVYPVIVKVEKKEEMVL